MSKYSYFDHSYNMKEMELFPKVIIFIANASILLGLHFFITQGSAQELEEVVYLIKDLIGERNWNQVGLARVSHNDSTMTVYVQTNETRSTMDRASLETELNWNASASLLLDYQTRAYSNSSNVSYVLEIRDLQQKVLWDVNLSQSNSTIQTTVFNLPPEIFGKPVEIRLYLITSQPGEYSLIVRKAMVVSSPVDLKKINLFRG